MTNILKDKFGLSNEQIKQVEDFASVIEEKIILDSDLNCHFEFKDKIFYMRPLTRKLGRKYTQVLEDIMSTKDKNQKFINYNKYENFIDECFAHAITNIRDMQGNEMIFDINEMSEPHFDELVMYLNVYFKKYKKK